MVIYGNYFGLKRLRFSAHRVSNWRYFFSFIFRGLLQPYSHLDSGRIASSELKISRWESQLSVGSVAKIKEICINSVQNKFNYLALSRTALVTLFFLCVVQNWNTLKVNKKKQLAMTFCDFHSYFHFFVSSHHRN